ncbi:MAG: toll/interleukin-1 receptor domain-containing protein [Xanthobacteraceae bacterium]
MAFVPVFEHDVFISYAHFDNEPDTQEIRWVSRFQADLKTALRQRLGTEPNVFFDTRNLQAHHDLEMLTDNVCHSAVFLAVLSPSYVKREWTIKELEAFDRVATGRNRIVTVELLPVKESDFHPRFLRLKRAQFWWKDEREEDIPLKLTPRSNPDKYDRRLQTLAHQMEELLRDVFEDQTKKPQSTASVSKQALPASDVKGPLTGKTILLAQATMDLYDDRDQVLAYLKQFGATVLPDGDYLQGGREFAEAVKADVARTDLFVQLLGPYRSNRPPDLKDEGSDEPKSYAQFQYDAAKARGAEILQWRRPDIDPAAITHWDKRLLEGPEVLAMGLQEFMKEIKKTIERSIAAAEKAAEKAVTPAKGTEFLFINADSSDKELADQLLKAFEDRQDWMAASPLFEGSAEDITKDLDANLVECGALMLVYGKADAPWVRAQLRRYSKLERLRDAPPRVKTILFAPPAPKPDISVSGGFTKIDFQNDLTADNVDKVVAELRR